MSEELIEIKAAYLRTIKGKQCFACNALGEDMDAFYREYKHEGSDNLHHLFALCADCVSASKKANCSLFSFSLSERNRRGIKVHNNSIRGRIGYIPGTKQGKMNYIGPELYHKRQNKAMARERVEKLVERRASMLEVDWRLIKP